MITIPNKIVSFISQDVLKIFVSALFIEFKDERLICLIDDGTIGKRVSVIRESTIFNNLIEALDLFGENDVLHLLAPKIELFANDLSLGVSFEDGLYKHFTNLI